MKKIGIVGASALNEKTILTDLAKYGIYELASQFEELEYATENYRRTLPPIVREGDKIGRNDKCTCGSGIKFKKCCINKL